jgi:hypothetical protein
MGPGRIGDASEEACCSVFLPSHGNEAFLLQHGNM